MYRNFLRKIQHRYQLLYFYYHFYLFKT